MSTVVHLMNQVERQPAHRVAVESAGVRITVGELRALSNRLANAFIGLGLERGDRVAYAAQNHPEYVILEFALLKAGLVKVPLNFRLTPTELVRCMELADVRLAVADEGTAAALEGAWPAGEGPLKVVIGRSPGWRSFDSLIAEAANTRTQILVAGDDLYHIRFSSGSTGTPKGIAISQSAGRRWPLSGSETRPRRRFVSQGYPDLPTEQLPVRTRLA